MSNTILSRPSLRSRISALFAVVGLVLIGAWWSVEPAASAEAGGVARPWARSALGAEIGELTGGLESGLARVSPARSAPTVRITRYGDEFPNGGWIANRDQQFVIHLCTDQTIGSTSVTSPRGQVEPDAQAVCGGGQSGTAYFLTYDSLVYNNGLLDGANAFAASACNGYPYDYECTYFNGMINYGELMDSLITATVLEPALAVRRGVTDTIGIRLTNAAGTARSLTMSSHCTIGLGNCLKLNDAYLPAYGSDTVFVRVRGDSIGIGAVAIWGCFYDASTAQDKCGFGSHPVGVLPPLPVAAAVVVNPSTTSTTKGQGATFSLTYRVKNTGSGATTYSLSANCPTAIVASGCAISPSSATINAGDSTTVTVGTMTATSPGSLTTGAVSLTAWAGGANATGQTAVTVGPNGGTGGSPSIAVASLMRNPQGSIARDQCLMVAAGEAAGVECGDLRIAHGLPGFQTMGKGRAPTLLYQSRHARPVQLLSADVTVLRATPDTITTTLTIPGEDPVVRSYAWSSACQNITCRIVVPVDAEDMILPTGVYSYTLQVQMTSGSSYTATDTGTLAVVNRKESPFGRGWWLEGLEQLVPVAGDTTRVLWVGGDGSTRLYKKVSIGSSTYLAVHPLSRPDTLIRFNSIEFRRLLPNKAYVTFNTGGQHTSTVNSQGHVTTLKYASGTLDSLILPVPSGSTARPHYTFHYAGSGSRVIDSVRAFRNSSSIRTTTIHRYNTWRIARIVDPDTTAATRFDSTSSSGRIGARVSRAGHAVTYAYDSLGAVSETQIPVSGDTTITTRFCPAETRSVVVCTWGPSSALGGVPLPDAVTRLDGPRGGLIDVMTFIVNRFGSPDTLQDPIGGRTRLERSATFPALVTKMTDAMGQVQRAYYNSRGLVDSLDVVNPLGDGETPRTRITWHQTWALPTVIKPPLGSSTVTTYDATWPRATQQQTGSYSATVVTFAYVSGTGLLQSVTQPTITESFSYDNSLGNISSIQAGPQTTNISRDSLGAERVISDANGWLTETIFRNVVGRVDSTKAVSKDTLRILKENAKFDTGTVKARKQYWNRVPPRVRAVVNRYDAAGNLIRVDRRADSTSGAANATTEWAYDEARRVRWRKETSLTDSFRYDPAGLMTRRRTARGHVITQEYDAAGRLVARSIPTQVYPMEVCTSCRLVSWIGGVWFEWYDAARFPYYRTALPGRGESQDVVLVGDIETFGYDVAGRMLTANNRDARITRAYYPGGALKADTTRMRRYESLDTSASQYATHVFGLQFEYDRLGRRTRRTDSFGWQQTYAYADSLGMLVRTAERPIAGGDSTTFVFGWSDAGQLRTQGLLGTPNGTPILDSMRYDTYGRLTSRSVRGRYGSSAQEIFRDSLQYDARGKQSWRQTTSAYVELTDSARMRYDGFGAAVAVERFRPYGTVNYTMDEYDVDALGNALGSFSNRGQTVGISLRTSAYSAEKLTATSADTLGDIPGVSGFPAVMSVDTLSTFWDLSGNQTGSNDVLYEHHASMPSGGYGRATAGSSYARNFYDAANRLRIAQRTVDGTVRHTFLEYRYDALGRRIMVRTRMDSMAVCNGATHLQPPCLSTIDRFVWDGDQLLVEMRAPGGYQVTPAALETQVGTGAYFGQIRYMHAGGIDQPLTVRKGSGTAFVPHASGRGGYEAGTYVNGTEMQDYHWPARVSGVTLGADARIEPPEPLGWFGSLLDNKVDASGQIYMRNRYYDPETGRFTQRDPIGLKGGINQYGYAAGDPIGRDDPFGLDVDVACRELHTDGLRKLAQHCAVRVITEKGDTVVYELLQRGGLNHSAVANAEAVTEYDGKWVPVERPRGATQAQFDKAVMEAAARFIDETKGRPYHWTGGQNSNRFVYNIITTAGSLPPDAARRRSGGLDEAPGLCGGANLSTGPACARTP